MSRIVSRLTVVGASVVLFAACGGTDQDPRQPSSGGKTDWLGNGEINDECSWDWQCSADRGLVCRPTSYDYTPEYRCSPRAGDRGPCSRSEHCQDGMSCLGVGYSVLGLVVSPGACYPGNSCTQDAECDGEQVCRPTSWEPGRPGFYCRDRGVPNNACAEDSDCSDGLRCAGARYDLWGQLSVAGWCEPEVTLPPP